MDIRYLNPEEHELWDAFVDQCPYGTIFHKTGWLLPVARFQSLSFRIAACIRDGEILGGMAFTWKKKFGRIPVLQMPVKTPFFSPVIAPSQSKYLSKTESQLFEVAEALGDFLTNEYQWVQATFPTAFQDVRPFLWAGFNGKIHYTYRTVLSGTDDPLPDYDTPVRNKIKKGLRTEFEFRTGATRKDIGDAWELEQKSFRRQQFEMRYADKEEFTDFVESLIGSGAADMFSIVYQGQLVASRILVLDRPKRTAYDWTAGAHEDHLSTGLNQVLMYSIHKHLLESEFQVFDFVGAGTKSIAKYKSTFNFPLAASYSISKARGLARIGMLLKNHR
ncbi:MAG: GNAT family N-acetyltransferase [Bacteroidales bacterium]